MTSTEQLQSDAQAYYDLAKAEDFDTRRCSRTTAKACRPGGQEVIQMVYIEANLAYEEMEGVVAGVPGPRPTTT